MFEDLKAYHDLMKVGPAQPFPVNTEMAREIFDKHGAYFESYMDTYGYYNVFIICAAHGHVMYTVAKESDLGANLSSGSLKNSGLGKLWSEVKSTRDVALIDFKPYAPSGDDPASFIGGPLVDSEGDLVGVVALQISLGTINGIMQERHGMGETGETYLVGPDKLMRSDSYLDPTNHSVKASFDNPGKGSVDTEAAREALSGRSGNKIIIDYNGNPVLSAYSPLKMGDYTWAILAEIDEAEAFASVKALKWMTGIIAIIGLACIITLALWITRSITRPINNVI